MKNKFLSRIFRTIDDTRQAILATDLSSPTKIQEELAALAAQLRADPAFFSQAVVQAPKRYLEPLIDVAQELDPTGVELQASGSKAFLLEILRRAAYDWVLYRYSTRPPQKKIAVDAHAWLFEETESHSPQGPRHSSKQMTSFLAICEELELTPSVVRARVRTYTVKSVMNVGRPVEYRKLPKEDDHSGVTTHYSSVPLYNMDTDSD